MKWVRLKIYLFPLVMQEIEEVSEKYISTIYFNLDLINELNYNTTIQNFKELHDLRNDVLNI
jgi:hypothetical protein